MGATTVISFGYLHGPAPDADLVIDLRERIRDPHVSPELRYQAWPDQPVIAAVRNTAGYWEILHAARALAEAMQVPGKPLRVAVGCMGGRHRSATFAHDLALLLGRLDGAEHRDCDKPVVERSQAGDR
jgi:RNase adaptor protein for sRNA GlmZ degradation